MTSSVDTAVILAAGMGSRLGDLSRGKPKGFLEVGGKSLIERSCDALVSRGITKIFIGTGHQAQVYEEFAKTWRKANIQCVYNADYASTGSAATLDKMCGIVTSPFLLLEFDLLYELRALDALLAYEGPRESVILASGRTYSNDEVYIETYDLGYLWNVSKDVHQLKEIAGELVGISRLSVETLNNIHSILLTRDDGYQRHYEQALADISEHAPIDVLKIEDLVWCEIDNEDHLKRALVKILPQIVAQTDGSSNRR